MTKNCDNCDHTNAECMVCVYYNNWKPVIGCGTCSKYERWGCIEQRPCKNYHHWNFIDKKQTTPVNFTVPYE